MKNSLLSLTAISFTALFLQASAPAADSTVSTSDAAFAKKAAVGSLMEVKMGEMAEKQAASPAVKEFGALMVKDHSKAGEDLKAVATKKNLTLPMEVPKKHHAKMEDMAKLEGKAFDTAYVNDMVEDHRKDVAEFKMAAKETSDPDLKQFAASTLPVLEGHLQKIEAIQSSMK